MSSFPFCHPLGLENCQHRRSRTAQASVIVVRCEVSVHHRTGVEMEALTGASVAALTIYDMCKALSHDIEITGVRLLAKSGGRRTFRRAAPAKRAMSAPLYGLVLAGGRSTRMGARQGGARRRGAHAARARHGAARPARRRAPSCRVRADQRADPLRAAFPQIVDRHVNLGPIAGILAAQAQYPDARLAGAGVRPAAARCARRWRTCSTHAPRHAIATAYRSSHDGLPEPLCAVYEPSSHARLVAYVAGGRDCPRKFLMGADVALLDEPNPRALDNANTPEEYAAAMTALDPAARSASHKLNVQYYALLREQAGPARGRTGDAARIPRRICMRSSPGAIRFSLAPGALRVAINAEFAEWSTPLADGDAVVFIPPVAGG